MAAPIFKDGKYASTGQVCELLAVSYYDLRKLQRKGLVPEPKHRLRKWFIWTQREIEQAYLQLCLLGSWSKAPPFAKQKRKLFIAKDPGLRKRGA